MNLFLQGHFFPLIFPGVAERAGWLLNIVNDKRCNPATNKWVNLLLCPFDRLSGSFDVFLRRKTTPYCAAGFLEERIFKMICNASHAEHLLLALPAHVSIHQKALARPCNNSAQFFSFFIYF